MNKLNVAFLWHMHQPNYLDPLKGFYSMPWVRLHATKEYYDMARLAEKYPGMNLTFNLVPSLLEQLEDYAGGAVDYELLLSRKEPTELSTEEKEAILSRFFQANYDQMIRPLPRYMELLQFRGPIGTYSDIKRAVQNFAAQDYLDLQVLFNLAWFGFSVVAENEEIRHLIRKGRFFTTEEKEQVLSVQLETIKKLIPLNKKLWEESAIDLTTSPFYHPILPLLCDSSATLVCIPDCLLPKKRFRYPQDAASQVEMGLRFFEERFGKKPRGMWPSEGSVSPEALGILRNAGVQWAATDEGILARSIPSFQRGRDLYQPWEAEGLTMFFRDLVLSDRIGFVYARNPATVAVDDFIARLNVIAESDDGGKNRLVSVILDGENAWESYPGSGGEFLNRLYTRILKEPWLEPVSFSSYLDSHPPTRKIQTIFSGSWIYSNFSTWTGHQEEIDAWDALRNARDLLAKNEGNLAPQARCEAWLEIFRAEGSDWFWWYGDDHSSRNDPEFDRLFRAHLERVYQLMGIEAPEEIKESILRKEIIRADVEPTGFLFPVIDGRQTTFYEWISAGWMPAVGTEGAMSTGEILISDIYYGFNLESFFLRLDLAKHETPPDLSETSISLYIQNSAHYRIDIHLSQPDSFMLYRKGKEAWVRRIRKTTVAQGRILELGVFFDDIDARRGEKLFFYVDICVAGVKCERLPRHGTFSFTVPDHDFQTRQWQI